MTELKCKTCGSTFDMEHLTYNEAGDPCCPNCDGTDLEYAGTSAKYTE